jgi:hypothetical protein
MHPVTGILETRATTSFTVDDSHDAQYLDSVVLQGANRLKGAPTGGQRVLDDQRGLTRGNTSLDESTCTVILRCLSDGEGLDRGLLDPAPVGDSIGDRIGTECQSTNPAG